MAPVKDISTSVAHILARTSESPPTITAMRGLSLNRTYAQSTTTSSLISKPLNSNIPIPTTISAQTIDLTVIEAKVKALGALAASEPHQTYPNSASGVHIVPVVLGIATIVIIATTVISVWIVKKKAPERYKGINYHSPLCVLWCHILRVTQLCGGSSRHSNSQHSRQHYPQTSRSSSDDQIDYQAYLKRRSTQSRRYSRQNFATIDMVHILDRRMQSPEERDGGDPVTGGASPRRSRRERIDGLGIKLVDTKSSNPRSSGKISRSPSHSNDTVPITPPPAARKSFRVSFFADKTSSPPLSTDQGGKRRKSHHRQCDNSTSAEHVTTSPIQLPPSPYMAMRLNNLSAASVISTSSTEDLSTYHQNLARLKAERKQRVTDLGLQTTVRPTTIQPQPLTSSSLPPRPCPKTEKTAREKSSDGNSPGRKFKAYLSYSPSMSSNSSSLSPSLSKRDKSSPKTPTSKGNPALGNRRSKYGNQCIDKRVGFEGLKTWWDKLGTE